MITLPLRRGQIKAQINKSQIRQSSTFHGSFNARAASNRASPLEPRE